MVGDGQTGQEVRFVTFEFVQVGECCFEIFKKVLLSWATETVELLEDQVEQLKGFASSSGQKAMRGKNALAIIEEYGECKITPDPTGEHHHV